MPSGMPNPAELDFPALAAAENGEAPAAEADDVAPADGVAEATP